MSINSRRPVERIGVYAIERTVKPEPVHLLIYSKSAGRRFATNNNTYQITFWESCGGPDRIADIPAQQ
jgi:hypothetical protein